jgi:hypothetical protein
MILHAKRKGADSKLNEYVQQLPQRVEVPVLWSDDQLQLLQYPSLIHKARFCWQAASRRPCAARKAVVCYELGKTLCFTQAALRYTCAGDSSTCAGPRHGGQPST